MTTKIEKPPMPSKRTQTILIAAATGVTTYGSILQLQDDDDVGTDDEIGAALQATGTVFRKAASGKLSGRKSIIRAIADALYAEIGVEVPE
jgi:hypothetical protein